MSSNVPISASGITAPTPQNTPLSAAPIALGLSRPTVPAISEDGEEGSDEPLEGKDGALSDLQQHIGGMVQSKLAGLLGKSSGYIEGLPVDVKLNVEALKGVQVKQNELQNKFKLECLELERKYLQLQKPLYERRHAIITGTSAATSEEIAAGEVVSLKDDEAYIPLSKDVSPSSAGIPEFWLTALRNYIGLSELITERDADALKHLIDVRIEHINEQVANDEKGDANDEKKDEHADAKQTKLGYKIIFEFSPNEFFENKVLEKTYLYGQEFYYADDFLYDQAIGTTIQWKEDKDLTKEFEIKKQRNKNTNRTRLVRKARPVESFFDFFSPPVPPSDDLETEDDLDLQEQLTVDYSIGEDIKDKIIPRAVDYFTGKALEYEDDEEFDDDEDIDDDVDGGGSSGSGSVQDSESDGGFVPARAVRALPKARRGAGGAAAANSNPRECEQQ